MVIKVLGLNHNTPQDIRAQWAFSKAELPELYAQMKQEVGVDESVIVSTCNRTEVYFASNEASGAEAIDEHQLGAWLSAQRGVSWQSMKPHCYTFKHEAAVRHAFKVASGLDSMVLGEPQILGQVKEAVHFSRSSGALGASLNPLFDWAFRVAKEVRSNTAIGRHGISLAAAAWQVVARVYDDFAQCRVLLIGSGEMIELVAHYLHERGPKQLTFVNRTRQKIMPLVQRLNGDFLSFANMPEQLFEFDVIVSSTASQIPIIGLGAVENAIEKRRHRPMVMVDLAVPRDVEAAVGELEDVFLYALDDLRGLVNEGNQARQAAALEAEAIVEEYVQSCLQALLLKQQGGLIERFRMHGEQLRVAELERAYGLLSADASAETKEALAALSNRLMAQWLHAPTQYLREQIKLQSGENSKENQALLEAQLKKIFGIF